MNSPWIIFITSCILLWYVLWNTPEKKESVKPDVIYMRYLGIIWEEGPVVVDNNTMLIHEQPFFDYIQQRSYVRELYVLTFPFGHGFILYRDHATDLKSMITSAFYMEQLRILRRLTEECPFLKEQWGVQVHFTEELETHRITLYNDDLSYFVVAGGAVTINPKNSSEVILLQK